MTNLIPLFTDGHNVVAKIVDLSNLAYTTMLTWLTQIYANTGELIDRRVVGRFAFGTYMFRVIKPLAELITKLKSPVTQKLKGYPEEVAFGMSYDITEATQLTPLGRATRYVQMERLKTIQHRAAELAIELAPFYPQHVGILTDLSTQCRTLRVRYEEGLVNPT